MTGYEHLAINLREICEGRRTDHPPDVAEAYKIYCKRLKRSSGGSRTIDPSATIAQELREARVITRRAEGGRPGHHLHQVIAEKGEEYKVDCGCADVARWMDDIGVEGCEDSNNRKIIVDKLAEAASRLNWWSAAKMAVIAASKGELLKLSPGGLLDEALTRARAERDAERREREEAEARRRVTDEQAAQRTASIVKRVMGDKMPDNQVVWSYGVTTTPVRRDTLLPRTLASLAAAGFDDPLLGVDKCDDLRAYDKFGLRAVTCRTHHGDNFANWLLTAIEVYLRNPFATHYAVFEDDVVVSKGAMEYLSATCDSDQEYWNLFAAPENEGRVNKKFEGWYISDQFGRGALGLVFRRNTFLTLLSTPGVLHHATNLQSRVEGGKPRGKEYVDGLIVAAMRNAGVTEMCHSPSIAQHTGNDDASGHGHFPGSRTFRGETFDMREMMKRE